VVRASGRRGCRRAGRRPAAAQRRLVARGRGPVVSGADPAGENPIAALARRHGLDPVWRDNWGNDRRVPEESLRALLAALGVAVTTPAQAAERLRALDASSRATMPTVVVGRVGEATPVPMGHVAPPKDAVAWRIECEDGTTFSGVGVSLPPEPNRLPGDPRGEWGLVVPMPALPGYHTLFLAGATGEARVPLIAAPGRCLTLAEALGRRAWGSAAQVYALRRPGDGGIGDLGAVAEVAERLAALGADALAISPIHALFAADPDHHSPYAPSSRLFLNPLFAAPTDILDGDDWLADLAREAGQAGLLAELEAAELVDHPRVARLRYAAFRLLFERFRLREFAGIKPGPLGLDFARFREAGGAALRDHARFEALHGHFFARDRGLWSWTDWPERYRRPDNAAVAAFADRHADEVDFHAFLQWITDRALAHAQASAREAGMAIGLIADLAVGTHPGGSYAWSHPGVVTHGIAVGAPPDYFSRQGQNWGLAALDPNALRDRAYGPFIAQLRAAMRHAGGVRIDHVMGLERVWCVPAGAAPDQGAYLRYPFADLLGVLALESTRNRAVVIGEDLGTVPFGFRDQIARAGIAGMRVLWFEQDEEEGFTWPEGYDSDAVALSTTHDLPSAVGWWRGSDIALRAAHGLLPEGVDAAEEHRRRRADRDRLAERMRALALLPPDGDLDALPDDAIAAAVATYLAMTPAPLVLLPLEDLLALAEQPNLPGTSEGHPNWRRRLPAARADLHDATVDRVAGALAGRGRPPSTT